MKETFFCNRLHAWVARDGRIKSGHDALSRSSCAGWRFVLDADFPRVGIRQSEIEEQAAMRAARCPSSLPAPAGAEGANFDGVAAGLRVNAEGKAPLLCVSEVFKVASGNLSLPGKIKKE